MNVTDWLAGLVLQKICFVNTYRAKQKIYPILIHERYAHGFIYTISGTETYHFHDRSVTTPPGSVLYIPKGEDYSTTLSGEESVAVVIDFEIEGEVVRPFSLPFVKNRTPESLFQEMEQLWNRPEPYQAAMRHSLFYRLLVLLIGQSGVTQTHPHDARMEPAIAYLHTHYVENGFRIADMIALSGLSQKYFNTLFQQQFQMAPKEYITFLKLERAKKLLLNGKTPVGEIAEQLGYCDIYHFSKVFKAHTGFSPTQYGDL